MGPIDFEPLVGEGHITVLVCGKDQFISQLGSEEEKVDTWKPPCPSGTHL